MMTLQERYSDYYKPLLRQFCKSLTEKFPAEKYHGIPQPFLPAWGRRYEMSVVKMAFVGKETAGWGQYLPEYIGDLQNERWESSFDISEFQDLEYVSWNRGHRYTFWGFVMYFLAALYGVKNWELLKQCQFPNILNSFLWGNASAIESIDSAGVSNAAPEAHQWARDAAGQLNDYLHLQKLFAPSVTIIMCSRGECNFYMRNTEKDLIWDRDNVRQWKLTDGSVIFNMPHPNRMHWDRGADFYAQTIREGLIDNGLFQPMPEFMDCDKDSETMLSTFFSKCRTHAHTTQEAVAFIATELRKQQASMTVRMLCNILNRLGYRTNYGSEYSAGRGSYRMISWAWKHYKEHLNQPDIAESIAQAFTKPNGDYAYWDY